MSHCGVASSVHRVVILPPNGLLSIAGPSARAMFLSGISRRTWTLLNEAITILSAEQNLNSSKPVLSALNNGSARTFSVSQPHLAAAAAKEKVSEGLYCQK